MLAESRIIWKTKVERQVHMKTVKQSNGPERMHGSSTGSGRRLSCVKVTAGQSLGEKKG